MIEEGRVELWAWWKRACVGLGLITSGIVLLSLLISFGQSLPTRDKFNKFILVKHARFIKSDDDFAYFELCISNNFTQQCRAPFEDDIDVPLYLQQRMYFDKFTGECMFPAIYDQAVESTD